MPGRVCGPVIAAGRRAMLAPLRTTTAAFERLRQRRAAQRALLEKRAQLARDAAAELREMHTAIWNVWEERVARVNRARNEEEEER